MIEFVNSYEQTPGIVLLPFQSSVMQCYVNVFACLLHIILYHTSTYIIQATGMSETDIQIIQLASLISTGKFSDAVKHCKYLLFCREEKSVKY